MQEKIEALETFMDELNSAASDIQGSESEFDEEEPAQDSPEHEAWQTKHDEAEEEFIDGLRDQAVEALGNLSV